MSEVFDQIGQHVDDIAVINLLTNIPSVYGDDEHRRRRGETLNGVVDSTASARTNPFGYIALGSGLGGAKNWQCSPAGAFRGALIPRAEANVERTIANIKNYSYTLKEQREQLDLLIP